MIKITYPGTGNYSQFTFDGFGRNVEIQEYSSSTLTSTKQFVWSGGTKPKEARNATGAITAQYFPLGETISGTDYFYTSDRPSDVVAAGLRQLWLYTGHPGGFNPLNGQGSTREMTNSSGTIEGQTAYDMYGRSTQLQGSMTPDFGFAGYYLHAPSGLSLTRTRAYSPQQGRFINRDSIGEAGGLNLYGYLDNNPVGRKDSQGTCTPIVYPAVPPWLLPLLNWLKGLSKPPKKPPDPPPPENPPKITPPKDDGDDGGGGGGGRPPDVHKKPNDPPEVKKPEDWPINDFDPTDFKIDKGDLNDARKSFERLYQDSGGGSPWDNIDGTDEHPGPPPPGTNPEQ